MIRTFLLTVALGGAIVAYSLSDEHWYVGTPNQETIAYELYMGKEAYKHSEALEDAYGAGYTAAYADMIEVAMDLQYNPAFEAPPYKPERK